MSATDRYWEEYDGQDVAGFKDLSYTSLSGSVVTVPIEPNIDMQVAEIYRANGSNTNIRIYK